MHSSAMHPHSDSSGHTQQRLAAPRCLRSWPAAANLHGQLRTCRRNHIRALSLKQRHISAQGVVPVLPRRKLPTARNGWWKVLPSTPSSLLSVPWEMWGAVNGWIIEVSSSHVRCLYR